MARALALALLALLGLAPAAGASAVELRFLSSPDPKAGGASSTRYGVSYQGDPGEANDVSIRPAAGSQTAVLVEDPGATIRAGENCAPRGAAVVCSAPAAPSLRFEAFRVNLGDRDDRAAIALPAGDIAGEDGNDTISAGGYVRGGGGDDVLAAGPYAYLEGGPGADRMTGDRSSLEYPDRTDSLRVTFDGTANDGEAGEGDDVRGTFISIDGGAGDDVLESSGGTPETSVWGYGGDDRLQGAEGTDVLVGADGDDVLLGGAGDDQMNGDAGADLIRGGPGSDTTRYNAWGPVRLTPGDGPNDGAAGEGDDVGSDVENYFTSAADDHIEGTDAPNAIDGGGGNDVINAHGGDDFLYVACCGATVISGGAGRDTFHPSSRAGSRTMLRMRDGEADVLARCELHQVPLIEADPIDDVRGCASFLRLPGRPLTIRASGRGVRITGTCVYVATLRCTGELRVYARPRLGRRRVMLARGRYDVPAGKKRAVRLGYTRAGRRGLDTRSRLKFLASSHPDLNPPSSVVWPSAFQTVAGVLVARR